MKSAIKLICLFLSCCMLLSILPVAAHMEETDKICEICGQSPCVCAPEEDGSNSLCLDCGQAECVCDKTEETCLGADSCVDGIHVPDCPLYVAPTCTQDESCTLTENHLEGCPKIQSIPAPVSNEDTG